MPLDESSIEQIHLTLSQEFNRPVVIIKNTLKLFEDGNTVPFIARYRKDVTKELDEVDLRDLHKNFTALVNLEERRFTVLNIINEQGKLTPELRDKITAAASMTELEDLYLPYKPKRQTRAQKAREAGLEPLALMILEDQPTEGDKETILQEFINLEKGIQSSADALEGALDIITEIVSENAEARKLLREIVELEAVIQSKAIENGSNMPSDEIDELDGSTIESGDIEHKARSNRQTYSDYFEFNLDIKKLKHHQALAINRGENEGFLDVELVINDEEFLNALKGDYIKNHTGIFTDLLEKGVKAGFSRMSRTIKRETWVQRIVDAKSHAITVFAKNLKNLLLQPPLKGRAIIGIDPGYRNGCKIAVINKQGVYLSSVTVYPHAPQIKTVEAKSAILDLARTHGAYTLAIGNGTASRETEMLAAELAIEEPRIEYTIVSESGASIYSASDIARNEFPDLDVSIRGAISIARRLQDPLSELIKIDPKSIGVGLYQHDVNQSELDQELDAVVEDCVNMVGVDVNVASAELLRRISSLNTRVAKEIITKREKDGPFKTRDELKDVKYLGEKTFEQAIGFLKIIGGNNPLDSTFIHPESYDVTSQILKMIKAQPSDLYDPEKHSKIKETLSAPNSTAKFKGLTGDATLRDIIDALCAPRRDPRDELPPVILKKEVLKAEDLKPGMILKGTVRNVVDFGAFVDIGLKYNGLVHISEIANAFVKNPHDYLSVGDVIDVAVKSIDLSRNRIQLSIKAVGENKEVI